MRTGTNNADGVDKSKDKNPLSEPIKNATEEVDLNSEETKKVASNLDQPGALEVEEMPESTELQDRRNKTKETLKGTVDVDSVPSSAAFADDSGGIGGLLKEANLSTRHFKFCCSGIFVILFLIAISWGGIKAWDWFQDRPEDEVVEDVPETDYQELEKGVQSGVIVGESEVEIDVGTDVAVEIGEESTSDSLLEEFIDEAGQMYELLQVNVQDMLDQSRDRQESLDEYVDELSFVLRVGQDNLDLLELHKANIEIKFDATEEVKNNLELAFFEDLKNFNANASVNELNEFTDEAELASYLKAQFAVREKLISYYEILIDSVALRLTDIDLNEEALVKGVQVVDIKGSDLDLIIDESQL